MNEISVQVADRSRDWVRNPGAFLAWWALPLLVAFASDRFDMTHVYAAFIWSAALAWMGIGCLLNAQRCHRRHCYISGPIFFAGAAIAALLGLAPGMLGEHGLTNATSAALVLALLSFVPEAIWGRYRQN